MIKTHRLDKEIREKQKQSRVRFHENVGNRSNERRDSYKIATMSVGSGGSISRRELVDYKQAREQRKVSKSIQKINGALSNSEFEEVKSKDGNENIHINKAMKEI